MGARDCTCVSPPHAPPLEVQVPLTFALAREFLKWSGECCPGAISLAAGVEIEGEERSAPDSF